MPATLSKPTTEEEEAERREAKALTQAKHLIFLNLAAWLMMIPARPEMVLRVTGGDAIRTSQILGSMTAAAAAFEVRRVVALVMDGMRGVVWWGGRRWFGDYGV